MIINHNLSAINAQRQFKLDTLSMDKSAEKLSSGIRINRAGDDAAGLAVSEKMRSQIRGLNQASRNAQDAISFIQTAEGWLQETTSILQRMRELSVQSANGIYTTEDRLQIQVEIEELVDEVDRIASQAEFNNLRLLKGGFRRSEVVVPPTPLDAKNAEKSVPLIVTDKLVADDAQAHTMYNSGDGPNKTVQGNPAAEGKTTGTIEGKGGAIFHIGPNMDHREIVYIENMSSVALGIAKRDAYQKDTDPYSSYPAGAGRVTVTLDLTTQNQSNKSIERLDAAINMVSRQRADLGAYQNRLETAMRGIDNTAENLQSSESRIRDTDMAKEMVNFVKDQILTQGAASLLTQANMRPQVVMRILG